MPPRHRSELPARADDVRGPLRRIGRARNREDDVRPAPVARAPDRPRRCHGRGRAGSPARGRSLNTSGPTARRGL
jgi:hypothetical protein